VATPLETPALGIGAVAAVGASGTASPRRAVALAMLGT
jgi:hypothetical protein